MLVTLKNGREQTIYYFAREAREDRVCAMPDGFVVVETTRTGMPVLKRA